MSLNPFQADPAVPERLAAYAPARIAELVREAGAVTRDGVMSADDVASLVARFCLRDNRELMLLLLDFAREYAKPPISKFFVGAIGLETTGNLVFGGNVEFPGTHLAFTLHGEGFVATRAFNRGTDIAVMAIGEAHPCAHCRQYLSEFAASRNLELIDPLGHTLTLAQLYPWPFDPHYLGESGALPAHMRWPDLKPEAEVPPDLLAAGRRAHTPYSRCPGAVLLELHDGTRIVGAAIESVAFNPTVGPLQAALIDLLALGHAYPDIAHVTLGTVIGGAVDYAHSTAELLDHVAPAAQLTIIGWTP